MKISFCSSEALTACLAVFFSSQLVLCASNVDQYSYAIRDIEDDLTQSRDVKYGHLTGDIQNWAAIIQNYIIQVI